VGGRGGVLSFGRTLFRSSALVAGVPIALLALFAVGALTIQVRPPGTTDERLLALTDGEEVLVTAHVIRGGEIRQSVSGELRQSIDVEV
jgi:outer membrane receptor protein involved in Fe transport